MPNAGPQLRRAITIQADGTGLLEKHAVAPSAARPYRLRARKALWLKDAAATSTAYWYFNAPIGVSDNISSKASASEKSK
ncbi:MAG TPA: hypothetical protein VKC61_00655 [Pyrinomonadaceae bacterium]|nr:hypothetical protein [Pyrinomonadaceae bacterium]